MLSNFENKNITMYFNFLFVSPAMDVQYKYRADQILEIH